MNLTGDALWALGVCRDNVSRSEQGPQVPRKRVLGGAAMQGKEAYTCRASPTPATLVSLRATGIFLDFEVESCPSTTQSPRSHLHTYSACLPWPPAALLCLGAPKSGQMVISTVTLWVKG